MAFVRARNGNLDERFAPIATEYMRHGEDLGVRWDYAFFQMLVETGNLSFKRGNGQFGDVKPSQNNFAGLGATGGGVPGESFPDVSTGVKAHLQHVLMYAGQRIEDPVAERTRKIQEWGVLTSWQKGLRAPITFTDLTRQWAPRDASYSNSIGAVAKRYYDEFCGKPDPQPELVQEARAGRRLSIAAAGANSDGGAGAGLSRNGVKQVRPDGSAARSGRGASALVGSGAEAAGRSLKAETIEPAAEPPSAHLKAHAGSNTEKPAPVGHAERVANFQIATAATTARRAVPAKCRVWTASYGGQKAIIIKAVSEQHTNYTVLDVNEGAEKREAEAYIAAYAKGGQQVGEFANQSLALEKAFEFCPEG
jgi:Mannosyl-glycoprotein endo-beta-N-acetylglucosaminidase